MNRLLSMLFLLSLLSGCARQEVYTDYGRRGGWAQTSVNGTRALGAMFEQAGHVVRSWSYLSPSLDEADVIVWAPDDFEPPSVDVQLWLANWVDDAGPGEPARVLIYIGRDHDAAPDYWRRVQANPPAGLKQEYARRLNEARVDAISNRPNKLQQTECKEWFTLDDQQTKAQVKKLTGPWAKSIDASKTNIHRHTRLLPTSEADTLLADGKGKPLVSELSIEPYMSYSDEPGRVIFVENGSFLLNAPLVNHEHRKLAGRLVAHVGPPKKRVVFLESHAGGPAIRDTDPSAEPPTGLELFTVWPIGAALTQLAALGVVFALMCWPVFGIPRSVEKRSPTDFGSHVAALGKLLGGAKDRAFAVRLLLLYRQSLDRDNAPRLPTEAPLTPKQSNHESPELHE